MDPNRVYPPKILIGTKKVFANNDPYVYCFHDEVRAFVCNTTTNNGFPNEVLVLLPADMQDGAWFVAVEGSLRDGVFEARQSVFRTQENFWEEGQHHWQVNKNAGREPVGQVPDAVWDSEWVLISETRVQ